MRHFAHWLETIGTAEYHLHALSLDTFIRILGAYVDSLKHGDNPSRSTTLASKTICNYLTSAASFVSILTGKKWSIYDPASALAAQPRLHPYLAELLRQRRTWSQPRPQKEPFTLAMFEALHQWLDTATVSISTFVSQLHAVFDWTRLGCFTGSRFGEYGQSKIPRGKRFATIPNSVDAGQWAGKPIAFIRSDFTHYDAFGRVIPPSLLYRSHYDQLITEVHIRFRFDKSGENFIIRKFSRTDHPILCPVDASVSIIHRACLLNVPEDEPLGVFAGVTLPYIFLRDFHVTDVMRKACIAAYPDPQHYLRQRIKCLVTHSNRVTAAVVLQNGGCHSDEIAFRLRWKPESVPTYLRECFQGIGDIMQKALFGAIRASEHFPTAAC
jgi:hypothetical protein